MKTGAAVLGAVVFLAACGEADSPEDSHAGGPEQTLSVTVEAEEIRVTTPVQGTVMAPNRAEITTRMMARVTELAVDVGSSVRAGQLLVRLGTEDIDANRAKAEASVLVARASRDDAIRNVDRFDALLAQDVVAQVQSDQAHLRLAQAEAQLAIANATLLEVETAGSYATIVAPFDGEVVARLIDRGDLATPGAPLLVVEEAGPRDGWLAIPVEAARGLVVGSSLRVSTVGDRTVDAVVRAVSAGADPTSRTVEARVVLPEDWPTGVSVTALVPTATVEAVTIPTGAVVRRGQLTGVRVVTDDGVVLRWIRLGRTVGDGARVQVLSGLSPGSTILAPEEGAVR
jgi:RND family efflux transporter MFP subunit